MDQDQKNSQKDIRQLSKLASDIYNTMVVLHYFCENQPEIEELSNILPIVANLRRDADTINAFFINFNLKEN